MTSEQPELVRESVAQLQGAWRLMAAPVAGSLLTDAPPLSVSIAGVPHFILNTITITEPVSEALLPEVARGARAAAGGCPAPWLLMTCDDWMPDHAGTVLGIEGLSPAMKLTGMVTGGLAPARRSAPEELDIRTGVDEEMVRVLFDVNSHAYGMPLEMGQASIRPGLFSNAWCAAGYAGSSPASVAVVYRVGNCLYVAWVATMPGFQRKGYAEAVMRRAIGDASAATGVTRTALHASAAGQPLYTNMGYSAVTGFTFYAFGLGHE